MRIHHRSVHCRGIVVTNHPDIFHFARNSERGGLTVLLQGRDLIANSVEMSSHCDTLSWAGIDGDYFDLLTDDAETGIHRANMDTKGISVEIWSRRNLENDFPYTVQQLEGLLDYLENHPRLKRAPDGFEKDIIIYDEDCHPAFKFTGEGLEVHEDAPSHIRLPGSPALGGPAAR